MPRIIIKATQSSQYSRKLLNRLIQELREPSSDRLPLILEEHHANADGPMVTVIWDEWEPVSFEERGDIIVEAYRKVEGDAMAKNLDLLDALTPEEALSGGYLPYLVVPRRRKSDKLSPVEYKRIQAKEAERTILGEGANELRYVRREDAEEAVKRLRAALPGSQWGVVFNEDLD